MPKDTETEVNHTVSNPLDVTIVCTNKIQGPNKIPATIETKIRL